MKLKIGEFYYNSYSKEFYFIDKGWGKGLIGIPFYGKRVYIPSKKDKKDYGIWATKFEKVNEKKLERAIKKFISIELKKTLIMNFLENL